MVNSDFETEGRKLNLINSKKQKQKPIYILLPSNRANGLLGLDSSLRGLAL